MMINQWAIKHGIPVAALDELLRSFGIQAEADRSSGGSEAAAQKEVQLEATRKGARLWRNNVGALLNERGVPIRYGLANESKEANKIVKSSDLIGINPVVIHPSMIGSTIGQFVAREMKAPGWKFNPKCKHEKAQLAFLNFVNSKGGDAAFCTGEGTL